MEQVLLPDDREPTADEALAYVEWLLCGDSVAMIRLGRGIDEGVLEALVAEVARLREEVAALRGNPWAAFSQHRLQQLDCAVDYQYQTTKDWEEAGFLSDLHAEIGQELARRKGEAKDG